jgi:hypothetical protein
MKNSVKRVQPARYASHRIGLEVKGGLLQTNYRNRVSHMTMKRVQKRTEEKNEEKFHVIKMWKRRERMPAPQTTSA